MKNFFLSLSILALAATNLFAFNIKADDAVSKDVIAKLEQAKQAGEQTQAKYVTGVFLEGSFSKDQLAGKEGVTLRQGIINITFNVELADKSSYGNIVYKAVKTDRFDSLEFNMETAKLRGGGDPHAPVDVYVVVSAVKGGKEVQNAKVLLLTVEALSLYSVEPSSAAKNTTVPAKKPARPAVKDLAQGPAITKDGKCANCGSDDPYHCNGSYTGPCNGAKKPVAADNTAVKKPAVAAKDSVPTKVVYEEDVVHVPSCKDPYHCGCPTEQVRKVVPMQKVEVKVHKADCKDPYHCDCPTKTEYR